MLSSLVFSRYLLNAEAMNLPAFISSNSNSFESLICSSVKSLPTPEIPEIILHQRQGDVKRTRPAQTIDEIHNMQKISTEIARRVSEESNAKIKIFSPENETVAEVIDFLKY